jgi:transcriptional regulator with XRE-family HTH domain
MTDKSHTYKTRFADWLDDELRRKGNLDRGYPYRQYELAHAVGVRPATVSLWINGDTKPNTENRQAIADFFGVNVALIDDMVDNPWPMPGLDPPLQAVVDRLKGLSREQRSKAIAGILFWLELVEESAAGRTAIDRKPFSQDGSE